MKFLIWIVFNYNKKKLNYREQTSFVHHSKDTDVYLII